MPESSRTPREFPRMPAAQAGARKHIESFRRRRGLANDDLINSENLNLADLTYTLTLTSTEFYADSFHFFWEIIQNNDDAYHQSTQPQLDLILTDEALYVWSNQVGFTKADVESICGIGRSSKKLDADTIGEKGIGFKSLFTVADRVTIHSEPYHFQFDITQSLLGMIIPLWVEEPAGLTGNGFTIPADGTTIALHLKPQIDMKLLRHKLEHLGFSFLIFCRRLKKIRVSYRGQKAAPFEQVAELCDKTDSTVTLQVKGPESTLPIQWKFRLFSNNLTNMPERPERPQQRTSVVRLAFPLPKDWNSGLIKEKTYAFMPISERFGFNFMIHANFILNANRSGVIRDRKWNIELRSGLVDLIYSAIVWFATSGDAPTNHHWLRYVNSLYSVDDSFFQPLAFDVCERLRTTPLLMTDADDAGFFQTPVQALLIPTDFRFNGKLILDGDGIARRSINEEYTKDLAMRRTLEDLGVKTFGPHDFLCELENMVRKETAAFRSKSQQWHSCVAAVLLASQKQYADAFFSKCKGLDIVPLNSGEWAAPNTTNLFLSGGENQDMPSGVAVKVVEATACTDRSRRLLFETLGVRHYTKEQVCEAILADHRDRPRGSIAGKDTVPELKFLFLSNYQPRGKDRFRFYVEHGKSDGIDRTAYIPFGEMGSSIRKQLGPASTSIHWLHASYLDIPSEEQLECFVIWLQGWSQVGLWPEVRRDNKLTPAMANLFASEGSKALLGMFWLMVKNDVALPVDDDLWKLNVSNLEVSTDQGPRKLCETALPSIARRSEGMVPGLEIADPEDQTWSFLDAFGVMTSVNARFLLQKLRNIKSVSQVASIDKKVSKIYLSLGKFTDDRALVREAFESEELIYLGEDRWAKSQSCRWRANYDCTAFPLLSEMYPRCTHLFKQVLGLRTANLDDLLEEFRTQIDMKDSGWVSFTTAETAYRLLLEMNEMLCDKDATAEQLADMKHFRMFPTLSVASDTGRMSMRLQKSTDTFWIGDIPWLQKRFRGKVPLLLPIKGTTTKELNAVFKALKMGQMRLTQCVHSEYVSDGPPGGTDERLTRYLRPKIPYMISILKHVEETRENRREFIAELKKVHVQRIEGIKIRRYVENGDTKIYGTDEEGEICLKPGQAELMIHMDPKLLEPDVFDSLAEHFSKYWNLRYKNRQLLYKLLTSTSPKRYTEAFERAGITIPDSDETSSQWISSKGKERASSVIPDPPSLAGDDDDTVRASGDENDEGNSVPRVSRQSGNARPRGSGSRFQAAGESRWVERTANARLTDDTAFQYGLFDNSGREIARPSSNVVNYGGMRRRYTSSAGERNHDSSTNAHRGGARRTFSTSSVTGWSNVFQGTYLQDDASHTPSSSQQPYEAGDSSIRPGKRRRLNTGVPSGPQGERLMTQIGRAGEKLVFEHFRQILGTSFSHIHWTSANRGRFYSDEPFVGGEVGFSDFTYKDLDGRMGAYFARKVPGFVAPSDQSVQPTYHLEVKTSLKGIEMSSVLRNNQVGMARRFSKVNRPLNGAPQHDVYVLVRVYDLDSGDPPQPRVCFYPDPWDLICRGKLAIEGDEGLYVRPMYL